MNYVFQILSGKPIMGNSMDEVLKKRRLQQLGKKQRNKTELELLKLGPPPKYIISPELLQDTLNLTKDTVSTLLEIKQKRLEMSQQDNKPFQWDDRKVKHLLAEYWNIPVPDLSKFIDRQIEHFKESYSSISSSEKVDWEIESYRHPNSGTIVSGTYFSNNSIDDSIRKRYSIHSVRRLSDNTVWRVGDVLDVYGTITKFKIQSAKGMIAHTDLGYGVFIEDFKKAPRPEEKPILFTVDGKGINIGDYFYVAAGADMLISGFTASENDRGFWKNAKLFLSKKEADEYILLNKPCLSVNDILKCPGAIEAQSAPSLVRFSIPYDSLKQLASSKIEGGEWI